MPRQLRIPYLRVPCFVDGETVRFAHSSRSGLRPIEGVLLERVFQGGATLEELAELLVREGGAPSRDEAVARLERELERKDSAIGLAELSLEPRYDVIVVDQGYGGVYVHTSELLKELRRRWRCLLLCPEEPLFEADGLEDTITLRGLRREIPALPFFSWVHLVRSIVQLTSARLLLLTHRSQSLFLFDLLRERKSVIYCDGYYDGGFRRAQDFRLEDTPASRRRILAEIYYLLSNSSPDFFGFNASPAMNVLLLQAGCFSLRDADENWCWGAAQREHLGAAFPDLRDTIRFEPPFTNPDLFRPELEDRERVVLYTTTMHNIEKKGLPELVRAMVRLRSVRVRCVVRQPQMLPEIPPAVRARMEIGSVAKEEMVRLYHRVWLNCRVSREESSPVSILESMVCRVPQIVSPRVAEQIPLIEDGVTGFVVDADDARGLVRALKTLLADPELRERMGDACRERAKGYALSERIETFERLLA